MWRKACNLKLHDYVVIGGAKRQIVEIIRHHEDDNDEDSQLTLRLSIIEQDFTQMSLRALSSDYIQIR